MIEFDPFVCLPGCDAPIGQNPGLMCTPHWSLVPEVIRERIVQAQTDVNADEIVSFRDLRRLFDARSDARWAAQSAIVVPEVAHA